MSEFAIERQEREVTIGGEEYVLIELDGKERDKYLTGLSERVKIPSGGGQGVVRNFDGLQASLIAASLFKIGEDGVRTPVKSSTIQTWPARTINGLHEMAKELSAIGDEDEGAEKGNS